MLPEPGFLTLAETNAPGNPLHRPHAVVSQQPRSGYGAVRYRSHADGNSMRINFEIDDALMAEAQKASGQATKKDTVEMALRLMIRLRQQQDVGDAFGKYRWRGNLARSRRWGAEPGDLHRNCR